MKMHRLINVDHKDATLRTFILFLQTAREVMRYADNHLHRKAGVSLTKLIVLQALASNDGILKPSEIAEWTQTERQNITALINRMRHEGLVTVAHNTSNKRLVNVTMTDKGREILRQAIPVAKEGVNQVMLSITEGDVTLLEKTLRVLRQNANCGLESANKRSKPLPE